jgi:uncharacterized protein YaiL (DUF2058 family)
LRNNTYDLIKDNAIKRIKHDASSVTVLIMGNLLAMTVRPKKRRYLFVTVFDFGRIIVEKDIIVGLFRR